MSNTQKITELEKWIAELTTILEAPDRGTDMDELLITTGQKFAEAEFLLATRRAEVLDELLARKPLMSGNEQKVLVEARCAREARLARKIEQANRALYAIINRKKS